MTISLDKTYNPSQLEQYWYQFWESHDLFVAGFKPSAKGNFCILLPPPNVTGTLHMGHGFNQTLMDALMRYQRMRGANTLWQVGTDHAGIATQMVVERQLEAQGKSRAGLGREAFLEAVWQWKAQSGGAITQQMRRLGASADWSRERFTLDPGLSDCVTKAFVRLYQQGLIYRGKRLVNWDIKLGTAVSDLEVVQEEEEGKLWHIRYPISAPQADDSQLNALIVATTRPETLLGDVAVMVHPDDERYQHLIGCRVKLPLCEREIPIIADSHVDMSFGTGCVKVTPAHDFNDYAVAQRHGLPLLSVITAQGQIASADFIPQPYQGLERFAARLRIVADLDASGLLAKTEKHILKVPRGDRSGVIIEPLLTDQWFVATNQPSATGESMADRALRAVNSGEIRFYPDNWVNTYKQWLGNIQDWCISRQLWWGHRIPAWYGDNGKVYVAHDATEAQALALADSYNGALRQDNDVLDTWFSSALWPFSTLGWSGEAEQDRTNLALQQYLPSRVLVTGFDIIFFWVARMVMMTTTLTGKIPFQHVYVHGLIRDAEGQKMSKSKGNVLDPIDIIDGIDLQSLITKRTSGLMNPKNAAQIEKRTRKEFPNGIPAFGTDALRFTFASLASPGRDIKFDLQRCEGYRNFCNKLWNATRFVLMHCDAYDINASDEHRSQPDRWMVSKLQRGEAAVARAFAEYRFDWAAKAMYELVWEEFCDWYVECAKVQLQQGTAAQQVTTRNTLLKVLEALLRLLHPIVPFISEVLWQQVAPRISKTGASIMLEPYPEEQPSKIDQTAERWMSSLQTVVQACRNLRASMNISPASRVPLVVAGKDEFASYSPYVANLAKLSDITVVAELPTADAPVLLVQNWKLMLRISIDPDAERQRLDKELLRVQAEVDKTIHKLNNPSFLNRAPAAVVALEQARLQEHTTTLTQLQIQRAKL